MPDTKPTEWIDLPKEEIIKYKDEVIDQLKRQIEEMDRAATIASLVEVDRDIWMKRCKYFLSIAMDGPTHPHPHLCGNPGDGTHEQCVKCWDRAADAADEEKKSEEENNNGKDANGKR